MRKKDLRGKKIGVLMGGRSAEREVSLKSGTAVYNSLRGLHYNVVAIDAGEDLCSVLKKQKIDIAFIALHGGHGENGAVQGMLEIMGIPYTGSGIFHQPLRWTRRPQEGLSLSWYPDAGVQDSSKFRVQSSEFKERFKAQNAGHRSANGLPLPWVIKPATEGSSVGVE
jgi:D-alanine-D-alanine ligase